MGLFKRDLYRSFLVGFAIGAVAVYSTLGIGGAPDLSGSVVPSAIAAPVESAR
jgi:hypothetical protein